jgi:hypothetical protein
LEGVGEKLFVLLFMVLKTNPLFFFSIMKKKRMSTTYVSNETQLAAWDGTSNLQINASFSITTTTASSFPRPITASSGITIQSDPSASTIYVLTINLTNSTNWYGVFKIQTTSTVSISNLGFQCLSASFFNARYSSLVLAYVSFTPTFNPNVSFYQCSVVVANDPTNITYPENVPGSDWGGFVPSLDTTLIGSTISLTNCTYSGCCGVDSGCLIASGYNGGGTTYSCTITITQCFVNMSFPTGTLYNYSSPAGIMGVQSRYHNISCTNTIVNIYNVGTSNGFGGFLANAADGFSITNSYVIVTATSSASTRINWVCVSNGATKASTVSNCYFVNQGTNNFSFYNIGSGGSMTTLTNCAFQNGTVNTGCTNVNTTYTYTYSTNTAIQPFLSWDTSIWSNLNTTTPPILTAFTNRPPFVGYTQATSTPILDIGIPCLCRGMWIDTPRGPVPVELLREHDLVLVPPFLDRAVPIQRIFCTTYKGTRSNLPVRIPKDFFDTHYPNQDILLSPHHAVFYNGEWHLPVLTKGLYQDESFLGKDIEYYHIQLPEYKTDKLWCHNLPVDSWDYTPSKDLLEQEQDASLQKSTIGGGGLTTGGTEEPKLRIVAV